MILKHMAGAKPFVVRFRHHFSKQGEKLMGIIVKVHVVSRIGKFYFKVYLLTQFLLSFHQYQWFATLQNLGNPLTHLSSLTPASPCPCVLCCAAEQSLTFIVMSCEMWIRIFVGRELKSVVHPFNVSDTIRYKTYLLAVTSRWCPWSNRGQVGLCTHVERVFAVKCCSLKLIQCVLNARVSNRNHDINCL